MFVGGEENSMIFSESAQNICLQFKQKLNKTQIFNQMNYQLLSALLLLLLGYPTLANVIAQSGLTETKIPIFGSIFQRHYNYGDQMKMPQSGAKVVWATFEKRREKVIFLQIFKPLCSEQVTVYVAAYPNFSLYLNEEQILQGNKAGQTYKINLKVQKCKIYVLQFRVSNTQNQNAGLIYQIHQNETCTKCPIGTSFHECDCQCECNVQCDCQYPKTKWYQYPTCSCGCSGCAPNQILDKTTCQCECFQGEQGCPSNKQWNADSCECQCKDQTCPQNLSLNPETCLCQCKEKICPFGFIFNNQKCDCQCGRTCEQGFKLTENCMCICDRSRVCGSGKVLNLQACECLPLK